MTWGEAWYGASKTAQFDAEKPRAMRLTGEGALRIYRRSFGTAAARLERPRRLALEFGALSSGSPGTAWAR